MSSRVYGASHIWIEGNRIGLSRYASRELDGIVMVSIDAGEYREGEAFGVVESRKTASELISPCEMRVVRVNRVVETTPEVLDERSEEVELAEVEVISGLERMKTPEEYERYVEGIK